MLLRFLGIATISVTFLTVQAMSSMESSIANTPDRSEYTGSVTYLHPTIHRTAYTNFETVKSSAKSHELKQRTDFSNPPLPVRLRSNIDAPAKEFGKLLKTKIKKKLAAPKKQFVRHAYLPPSHSLDLEEQNLNRDYASDAIESQELITGSADKDIIIRNIETAKLETSSLTYRAKKFSTKKTYKKKKAVIKSYKKKRFVKKVARKKVAGKNKSRFKYKPVNYMASFN